MVSITSSTWSQVIKLSEVAFSFNREEIRSSMFLTTVVPLPELDSIFFKIF